MCKRCVADGFMSEDQRVRIEDGEDPRKVLTAEQLAQTGQAPQIEVIGNLDDAPQFLKDMLAGQFPTKDPKVEAQEIMDKAAEYSIGFMKKKIEIAEIASTSPEQTLEDPRILHGFMEMLAGESMYRTDPATLAYAFSLMTYRYVQLLDQWATLYVAACTDIEALEIDLDQAKTPESKDAVTKAAESGKRPEFMEPGFYL